MVVDYAAAEMRGCTIWIIYKMQTSQVTIPVRKEAK